MDESKLVYCQHMLYLSEQQAGKWSRIANDLSSLLNTRMRRRLQQGGAPSAPASGPAPPVAGQDVPVEDPDRVRMRRRISHVIRGLVLMIALGMPRTFFYLYGAYSVLVLSGVTDHIQSTEFRRWFTGARAPLDLQLSRLRLRLESIDRLSRLEAAVSAGEEVDAEDCRIEREFIDSFKSDKSWPARFAYQLAFMFVYSALPSCNPHAEYMV